jgi:hypothetical protein
VASGNVAAGKNHHHQGRTNGNGGQWTCSFVNHSAADGKHQEKSPNKLHKIPIHLTSDLKSDLDFQTCIIEQPHTRKSTSGRFTASGWILDATRFCGLPSL